MELKDLDLTRDQHLMSVRINGNIKGHVEIKNGKIVTNGYIGEKVYNNFVELIHGLQGYGISIDNFYF